MLFFWWVEGKRLKKINNNFRANVSVQKMRDSVYDDVITVHNSYFAWSGGTLYRKMNNMEILFLFDLVPRT